MTATLTDSTILALVIGMFVINFAERFLPLQVFSRFEMPKPVLRWLSYVPIAVMGSLVATEVLRPGGTWEAPLTNPGIYGALLTMVVFKFTRSFLGATIAGVVLYIVAKTTMGA